MNPSTKVPPDLRSLLDREGVEIAGSRVIDHGTQYDLARDDETAKLNVETLPSGVYLLQMQTENASTVKRIVKQ